MCHKGTSELISFARPEPFSINNSYLNSPMKKSSRKNVGINPTCSLHSPLRESLGYYAPLGRLCHFMDFPRVLRTVNFLAVLSAGSLLTKSFTVIQKIGVTLLLHRKKIDFIMENIIYCYTTRLSAPTLFERFMAPRVH